MCLKEESETASGSADFELFACKFLHPQRGFRLFAQLDRESDRQDILQGALSQQALFTGVQLDNQPVLQWRNTFDTDTALVKALIDKETVRQCKPGPRGAYLQSNVVLRYPREGEARRGCYQQQH